MDKEKIMRRFIKRISECSGNNCWNFTGSKNRKGYGHFYMNGFQYKAHRASFIIFHQEDIGELHILHSCDNPFCVNPAHLRKGTHQENMLDKKIRNRTFRNFKSKCPRGHDYSSENTVIKNGSKFCLTCRKIHNDFHNKKRAQK